MAKKKNQQQDKDNRKDKDQEKDIQKFSDYTPFICLASISRSDQRLTKAQQLTLHPGLCASFCLCLHILKAFSLSIPKIVVGTKFMQDLTRGGHRRIWKRRVCHWTNACSAIAHVSSVPEIRVWALQFSDSFKSTHYYPKLTGKKHQKPK